MKQVAMRTRTCAAFLFAAVVLGGIAGGAQETALDRYVKAPDPVYGWNGSLRVTAIDKPRAVNLWRATNPKARDFRRCEARAGFTASFVELVYDSGEKVPYKFTTQVHIVPDKLPHSFEEFRKTLK